MNSKQTPGTMKTYPDKNDLLKGEIFNYTNEPYQIKIENDDIRNAQVYYRSGDFTETWRIGYKIMFNGELIYSSKTFNSMKQRLTKLILKWNLTPSNF